MTNTRKGQGLVSRGIRVMVIVIVLGAVAIPVAQDSIVTDLDSVTNETINSTGAVPETLTAGTVEDGLSPDSETLYVNDSLDDTVYQLERGTDYEVLSYPDGEFNVTNADVDSDGNDEINATSDTYKLSYQYKPDGYIQSGIARTVLELLPLIFALALFLVAISLVR